MLLNEFLPKYVHLNGLKFRGALKKFSIASKFLGSKMQISNFEENKGFEGFF